ncbi:MAG: PHP domain-containing protein [Eubacteriales bacterium]
MKKPYVDLHIHSNFSDGSYSPEEIAIEANKNGLGLIALTDHNITDGIKLLRDECNNYNIRCISGVEIDSIDKNTNFHIIAYDFDEFNDDFLFFIKHTRFLLDELSVKLIELMNDDYTEITISDFMKFEYNKSLGGWKALHYFMSKKLTTSLKEGIKFYSDYNIEPKSSGYSSIAAIAYRVKKAGGFSVLAHPGELIDSSDIEKFKSELRRIASYGIDGIECYYPSHSSDVVKACIEICKEFNMCITAGSDCHGAFGKTRVGEMDITNEKIVLRN